MRDETSVLIGAGQFTFHGQAGNSSSSPELLKIAAKRTVAGGGVQGAVLARLDAPAAVAFSIDASRGLSKLRLPRLSDPAIRRRPARMVSNKGGRPHDLFALEVA